MYCSVQCCMWLLITCESLLLLLQPITVQFIHMYCCGNDCTLVSIHSLAHDQCWPFGVVLGPLHFPHQLEVGRDGGAAVTWPLQVVENHHLDGVGIVLGGG